MRGASPGVRTRVSGSQRRGFRGEDRRDRLDNPGGSKRLGQKLQVHDDLAEIALVGRDADRGFSRHDAQFNVFAEQSVEQSARVIENAVQIHRLIARHFLAAEHEQLPGQPGGAFSGQGYLSE